MIRAIVPALPPVVIAIAGFWEFLPFRVVGRSPPSTCFRLIFGGLVLAPSGLFE
jgi:hypothetical protein